MNNTKTSLVKISYLVVVNNHICSKCGSPMKELDRRNEGLITYVWFDCVKADCDGRWFLCLTGKEF